MNRNSAFTPIDNDLNGNDSKEIDSLLNNDILTTELKQILDYRSEIAKKMDQIVADPVFIKLIRDNYRSGKMGYTQTIATNAIKELKEAGVMPMDTYGEGIWGQGDWVRSNFPKDDYVEPVTSVTTTPVIPAVDPNPGASTTTINPGIPVVPVNHIETKLETTAIQQPNQDKIIQVEPKEKAEVPQKITVTEWYNQPVAQIIIGVVVVIILMKLFKN